MRGGYAVYGLYTLLIPGLVATLFIESQLLILVRFHTLLIPGLVATECRNVWNTRL